LLTRQGQPRPSPKGDAAKNTFCQIVANDLECQSQVLQSAGARQCVTAAHNY